MPRYPRTVRAGPLAGNTYDTEAEYRDALAGARQDGTAPPRKPPAPKITKQMAQALVQFSNLVLGVIPQTREDALNETEQEALTLAILETAKANRFFANLVYKICTAQSSARLVSTVGAIVAVRLARREVLPISVGVMSEMMLMGLAQGEMPDAPAEVAPVADPKDSAIDLESNGANLDVTVVGLG